MKKLFVLICVLVAVLSGMFYQVYIRRGNEEIEVLNADVSINNIKSIMEIENESNDDYEEVPLGYNDGNIYLIKYDSANNKLYDNNIFILNKDGTSKECGVQLPDSYLNSELKIYANKIFGKNGYFDWQSGKEYKLLLDEENSSSIRWYPVSGNSDYYLCAEENEQNKRYILYNINSDDKYEFENNGEEVINGIFYDDISKNFYAVCQDNVVKEIYINGSNFNLEKYDELKVQDKNGASQDGRIRNNYIYCSEGQAYIGLDYKERYQDSININQYDIANKITERLDNINLYGYDDFYKEYILIKKDDEKSVNKIYLAKLEKNGFDMLIEIPKTYGDDSEISIHMLNSENVLVKEEKHDTENKKIKNRYIVYDLAEYFQDNTNKLKSDADKVTLKNTYKNINEYDDSNNKSKLNNQDKNIEEVKQVETEQKDIKPKDSISKDNESNIIAKEEKDYRESNSSWRKGNGEWYYYENNEKAIGWLKTQKGWYYFYKDGTMQKDATVIGKNGKEYKLGHDGLLLNPDSTLDYDYDRTKEKANKDNSNNTKDNNNADTTQTTVGEITSNNNIKEENNASNKNTVDKQSTNDTNKGK